jgi:hypothetical protein
MPQQDEQQVVPSADPRRNPVGFVFENKDALTRMPEDKALRFADRLFQRYMLPKYKAINRQGLSPEEIQGLRVAFIAKLFDIPAEKAEISGEKQKPPGVVKKGAAALAAGGAGVLGGIRTFSELMAKLDKSDLSKDPIHQAISRAEGKAYEEAKSISPGVASTSAAVGHQIPAALTAEGVGSMIPKVGQAASLATKVALGGTRGAAEGAAFGATTPGDSKNLESTITGKPGGKDFAGDAQSGALWGGLLGAAFPALGKFFKLGQRQATQATSEVAPKVTEQVAGAAATAAPKPASSMGDLAEQLSQKHYNKAFKNLTPAEKAELPKHMKSAVAEQAAAKAAESKAKKDAVKAAKKLTQDEQTAARTAKAEAAKQTASKQAESRAAGGTEVKISPESTKPQASVPSSGVYKEAVAAKASEENPSIKKVMATETSTEAPKVVEPEVKKVEEGQHGKGKIARQAKERERVAAGRASGKYQAQGREATGGGIAEEIAKHVAETKAKYTPVSVGTAPLPELEEAVKELGGEEIIKSFQALRKAKKISDVMYAEHLKDWALTRLEEGTP